MHQVKEMMKAGEEKIAQDVSEKKAVKQISDPYTSDYTHKKAVKQISDPYTSDYSHAMKVEKERSVVYEKQLAAYRAKDMVDRQVTL
ncbi:hypothetical protein T484DRAFT_1857178 [Baffinella frigidus]|nr:hypothetical protein T484DRAFT_1857178 [Cryptophyta sp. CCMP2293]